MWYFSRMPWARLSVLIGILGCGLFATSLAADQPIPIHIDLSADTASLPYTLEKIYRTDYGLDRKLIQATGAVMPASPTASDTSLLVIAFNRPINDDGPASFVVCDLLRRAATVTEDPIYATITDFSLYQDRATGKIAIAAGIYRHDTAFVARNFPGSNRFDLLPVGTGRDRTGNGEWEPQVQWQLTSDYDFDGSLEMFFYVGPGRDKEPRSLVCVDMDAFRIEWSLPMASWLLRGNLTPCGDSADPALVFSTYGPDNGVRDSVFDDHYGYLGRIDRFGKLSQVTIAADGFCSPLVAGVPGNPHRLVVYRPGLSQDTSQPLSGRTAVGAFELIDDHLSVLRREPIEDQITQLRFVRGPYADEPLLYAFSRLGQVRLLDSTFTCRAISNQSPLATIIDTFTLPGESYPSLICASGGTELLSPEFEHLAHLSLPTERVSAVNLPDPDQKPALLFSGINHAFVGTLRYQPWHHYLVVLFWRYHNGLLILLLTLAVALLVLNYFRRRAEAALALSRERLRSQFEAMPIATCIWEQSGDDFVLSDYNAKMNELSDGRIARFVGRRASEIYVDRADITEDMRRCATEHATLQRDMWYRYATTGRQRYVATTYCWVPPNLVMIHGEDITERREATEALAQSEAKFRAVAESLRAAVVIYNRERLLYCNPVLLELTGYTLDEALSMPGLNFIHPDEREQAAKRVADRLAGLPVPEIYEVKTVNKAGETRWAEWSAHVIDFQGEKAILGTGLDVTERKLANLALEESEAKFRALAELMRAAILIYNQDRILYCNPALVEWTGYSYEEITSMPTLTIIHPDQRELAASRIAARLSGGLAPEVMELKTITKDGRTRWTDFSARVIDYQGTKAILGTGLDATERKLANLALEESEAKFRAMAESMNTAITIFDQTRLVYCNPACRTITGYSAEELAAMSFWEVVDPEYRQLVRERGRARLAGETIPERYEVRIRTKAGAARWVDYSAQVIDYLGGKAVLATIVDITDRKLAEERLRESEQRFLRVTKESREIVWEIDTEGLFTYVNPACETVLGYRPDEMIGRMHFYDLHPEETREAFREMAMKKMASQTPFRDSLDEARTRDGRTVWLFSNGVPLLDEHGVCRGYVGTDLDVTERRRIEEELRIKDRAIAASINAMAIATMDGRNTYVNDAFLRMWGYTRDEAMALPIHAYASDPEEVKKIVATVKRDGFYAGESIARRADGSTFHVFITNSIVPNPTGGASAMLVFFVDITERKQAEAELRNSEEKYRAVVEGAGDCILSIDTNGSIVFANSLAGLTAGVAPEELLGRPITDLIPRDSAQLLDHMLEGKAAVSATGELTFTRDANGQERWFSLRVTPLAGDNGARVGAVLFLRDITESIRASRQIERERDFSRSILDAANSLIICLDENACLTMFNEECERITGYKAEEVLGQRWPERFMLPENRHEGHNNFRAWVEANPKRDRYEEPILTRSGDIRTILWSNSSFVSPDTGRLTAIAIGYDITDRKRDEAMLQRITQEQYDQVKQIAGGIAHEIYNALFPASGSLYKLRERLELLGGGEETARNRRLLDLVEMAVSRAVKMTDTVMKYSRLDASHVGERTNLRDLADELVSGRAARIEQLGAVVTLELPNDLDLRVNREHLVSLLDNLLGNALDAVAEAAARDVTIAAFRHEGSLRLVVSDTGIGIEPDQIKQIFQPFFSTKPRTGTGLGLAIARKIVELYGGSISVDSVVDKGTRFTILLPAGIV